MKSALQTHLKAHLWTLGIANCSVNWMSIDDSIYLTPVVQGMPHVCDLIFMTKRLEKLTIVSLYDKCDGFSHTWQCLGEFILFQFVSLILIW